MLSPYAIHYSEKVHLGIHPYSILATYFQVDQYSLNFINATNNAIIKTSVRC